MTRKLTRAVWWLGLGYIIGALALVATKIMEAL